MYILSIFLVCVYEVNTYIYINTYTSWLKKYNKKSSNPTKQKA